jgi:hypothetical protein
MLLVKQLRIVRDEFIGAFDWGHERHFTLASAQDELRDRRSLARCLAIAVEMGPRKKFKISFDRNSCPLWEVPCKMDHTARHTLDHCYAQRIFFWAAWVRNRFCFIERAMRSQLLSEISRSGRRRWLQVDEMPFSRAITYKLIDAGLISSVVVIWPGSRRGRRLIDGDSPLR